MRGSRAITGLLVFAAALAVACGGGGGGDHTSITVRSGFPQGFLPVLLPTAAGCTACGDVAFRAEGDLFAVDGGPDVTIVSRTDGSVRTFAHVSGASLRSIAVGVENDARLFVGDDAGRIWAIAFDGTSVTQLVDTGSQPITGLAFAPSGFGSIGGVTVRRTKSSRIMRNETRLLQVSLRREPAHRCGTSLRILSLMFVLRDTSKQARLRTGRERSGRSKCNPTCPSCIIARAAFGSAPDHRSMRAVDCIPRHTSGERCG